MCIPISSASALESQNLAGLILNVMLCEPGADAGLRHAWQGWSSADRNAFLEAAKSEKCLSHCAGLLRDQLEHAQLGALDEQCRINAALVDITLALPASAILLKGMALQACYPGEVVRDSIDVDVCVPDLQVAGSIAATMRRLGYDCESTALWGAPLHAASDTPVGAVRFSVPGGSGKCRDASLELHLGGFSTSLATTVPYADWEVQTIAPTITGVKCLLLDATGQFCLMLTDYCVRRSSPVSVRHVVDMVYFLRKELTGIHPGRVRSFLIRHQLGSGLSRLISKAAECGVEKSRFPELALLFSGEVDTRQRSSIDQWRVFHATPQAGKSIAHRVLAVALFTLRIALLKGARMRWLRRWLLLVESSTATRLLYGAGMRVAVTPISRRCVPRARLRIVGWALFYETPMGVFSMSVHGFVEDTRRWQLYRLYAQALEFERHKHGR